MGLLSLGTPLSWQEVRKHADYVREHGIIQLLNTFAKYQDRHGDVHMWGDEVEYMIVKIVNGKATLGLRQEEILGQLMKIPESTNVSFHQEYGRYMVEATPKRPYGPEIEELLTLEPNMKLRRDIATKYISPEEHLMTITSYPRLGVGLFSESQQAVRGPATQSLFLPDDIINLHPRFPTLSANIRERRGKKVEISIPVYKDNLTPDPWTDPLTNEIPDGVDPATIYMDAMGFGMGCCCLQLTFQGRDIDEARLLYDELAPLTPIMLALSAASPVFRGVLADQDVRWNVVSAAVDDRTDDEKDTVPKSRYDSIDCYINRKSAILNADPAFYNDVEVVTNPKIKKQLEESPILGDDPLLVQHFSHLFIRDPLVIFQELIHQDDSESTDHFENIQTTNWQTVRFKPPPGPEIGWRTEFRPMEIQFTDFENAAFSIFLVLMTRVITEQDTCFYQPISQVDANMKTAHLRDPVGSHKFWFRTNVRAQDPASDPKIRRLDINEIINGGPSFEGLLPMIEKYLATLNADTATISKIRQYLDLISKRASGELMTNATWIRRFIRAHPNYKFDSVVSEKINDDLMIAINRIGNGDWSLAKGMLPDQ